MPPPVEGFAAHPLIGPALRAQPDRRLVALVRDGYETAFEEIVRRYGRSLNRYAAAIVGGRAEDVTQDAFAKALLAIRRDDNGIELRPWLFRIVRNTALNDLRDSPPPPEALAESLLGGARSAAEEHERREELADLIRRLQALPEAQRAAIVMRELEGLRHEEIAKALGLSDGGARQAIYRARRALRDGMGMLVPLPALKALMATAVSAPTEATAGVGGAVGVGVGAKAAAATMLIAGAVGTGVAIDHGWRDGASAGASAKKTVTGGGTSAAAESLARVPARSNGDSGAQGDRSDHHGAPHAGDDRGGGQVGGDRGAGATRHGEDGGHHPGSGGSGGNSGGGPSGGGGDGEGVRPSGDSGSGSGSEGGPGGDDQLEGSSGPGPGGDDQTSSPNEGPGSTSDDDSRSNSGPGSDSDGGGEGSGTEDSGDSGGGAGLSVVMEPHTQEAR